MSDPILFLTVGLPGTGKTTVARRLEAENAALRLTKDEWIKALYGHDNPVDSTAVSGRRSGGRDAVCHAHSERTARATREATRGKPGKQLADVRRAARHVRR